MEEDSKPAAAAAAAPSTAADTNTAPLSPRVLVTGAGSFIGSHVVKCLLDRGYRVRGAETHLKRHRHLRDMMKAGRPLELVRAHLLKPETWPKAMEGCDFVVHTDAMLAAIGVPEKEAEQKLTRPMIDGTLNVVRAAAQAGVKRVVMTSSLFAVAAPDDIAKCAADDVPVNDTMWTDPAKATPYCRSKAMAERAAWDFVGSSDSNGVELVCINPGIVVGSCLSDELHDSMAIALRLINPKGLMIADILIPMVHVLDVAEAHVNALIQSEASGKRFILVGQPMTLLEMSRYLSPIFEPLGYKVPCKRLPDSALQIAGLFDTTLRRAAALNGVCPRFDSNPAMRLLGVPKRACDIALVEMVVDAIKNGYAPRTPAFDRWDAKRLEASILASLMAEERKRHRQLQVERARQMFESLNKEGEARQHAAT